MAVGQKGWTACFSAGAFMARAVRRNLNKFLSAVTKGPDLLSAGVAFGVLSMTFSAWAQPVSDPGISHTQETLPVSADELQESFPGIDSNGGECQIRVGQENVYSHPGSELNLSEIVTDALGYLGRSAKSLEIVEADTAESATVIFKLSEEGLLNNWFVAVEAQDNAVLVTINSSMIENTNFPAQKFGTYMAVYAALDAVAVQGVGDDPVYLSTSEVFSHSKTPEEFNYEVNRKFGLPEVCGAFPDRAPGAGPLSKGAELNELPPVAVVRNGEVLGVSL